MHYHKNILIILATVNITIILLNAGCANPPAQVVPYVPPQYLNSLEVTPSDLTATYEERYRDFSIPNALFKDKSVVFKNIELTDEMLRYTDKGYMWIDGVYLEFDNPEEWIRLRSGSKVDIAGICKGLGPFDETTWVTLAESIFFPAGVVDLTGDNGGGPTVPIY